MVQLLHVVEWSESYTVAGTVCITCRNDDTLLLNCNVITWCHRLRHTIFQLQLRAHGYNSGSTVVVIVSCAIPNLSGLEFKLPD